MKKPFSVLWGIVFVFIVAGNVHAIPRKWTDICNPLGDTIAFGDSGPGWFSYEQDIRKDGFDIGEDIVWKYDSTIPFSDGGWNRTEGIFINLPRLISDQKVELNTLGTSSVSLTRLCEGFTFSGPTLNADKCENNLNPVPEPATMLILGCGLVGMAIVGRKKIINHT